MTNLRTTVILKTDIVDSTPRIAALTQSEMGLQRKQHKQFISAIAIKNLGSIFQEEGDAYWMEFPSVTTAALAAIEMHQSLRSMQAGKSEKQRLSIRAIITVGDILHQEQDTIGTTLSLTARIEKVTPPDEIYLSNAAWLILNKAEVHTAYVGEFNLKGFNEPEKVYRVNQIHRTRVFTNQYIVFTDLTKWKAYIKSESVEKIENFLLDYDDLLNGICEEYGGVVRSSTGDNYFLTFVEVEQTLMAIYKLSQQWKSINERHKVGLKVGIHRGDINIFRSYIYGDDIEITELLTELIRVVSSTPSEFVVMTTQKIRNDARGTNWERNFQSIAKDKLAADSIYRTILKDYKVYWFIVADNL
jgi:class 3 adenylate cyclase